MGHHRMKQLAQKLKNGDMEILDVVLPICGKGMVLIQNYYSLISAGTEGSTVSTARKSLIGKAKERPQQVKQVIETLKAQGPLQTYRAVMKKLDSWSPLGYSSAGLVVAVGEGVDTIRVGDKVACAGAGYANHAEIISVPKNLCVKLADNAELDKACYNTLGAIALQGIRQADLKLGETCVVTGLGLLGQLTCLMLRAAGVRVIGLDINESMVELAKLHSVDHGFVSGAQGTAEFIEQYTDGIGADAVIISAATSSLEPINFAGKVLKKRGSVIVVGAIPTGFDREPYFYKKELQIKMSCSYGPGRYDPLYEEKGVDYPAAYVRWTENRNMQTFQDLLYSGKIDVGYLTTHQFPLEDAAKAYELIMNKNEQFAGIVIEYNRDVTLARTAIRIATDNSKQVTDCDVNVSFLGAGSYALSHLLPNLKKVGVNFRGVLTSTSTSSRSVAEKFGFEYCFSKESDLFDDITNTVFIASRHNSHGDYVKNSLLHNKHVFVEKPLCLTFDELEEIRVLYNQKIDEGKNLHLMVGFNRRFSPLTQQIIKQKSDLPMSIIYRVNAGMIPADSWIQDREVGGGRILGEVCHFVDYMIYLTGSLPTRLFATAMDDVAGTRDTVNINIEFENGSTGIIAYLANGAKSLTKEYIEVYQAGFSYIINDFKEITIYGATKKSTKLTNQNKGQKEMVTEFISSIRNANPCTISFEDIYMSTLATFKILESIETKKSVSFVTN